MARWAARFLILTGTALLGWCAFVIADAELTQRTARRSLESAAPATASPATTPTRPLLSDARATARRPTAAQVGAPVAALSIPRVRLSAVVLHGSDARTLRRGPGHLEHTALPGEPGNAVIAGHRDTFFRPLRGVEVGDDVFVDAPDGRVHYRVTSVHVVPPREVSVLRPTEQETLTLITCYPFWGLGEASDRFVVRARRVAESEPAGSPSTWSQDVIRAPVIRPPRPQVPSGVALGDVPDGDARIRLVVERFRATYNARHTDASDGPLSFESCRVDVLDERATVTCEMTEREDVNATAPTWQFDVARTGEEWAIRSVTVR